MKYIVDVATGDAEKIESPVKNPYAQTLSKLGASKGSDARAKNLTAKKRKEILEKAALAQRPSTKSPLQ